MKPDKEGFVTNISTCTVKARWFTCNCTQLQLPDGTSILFDPFINNSTGECAFLNKCAFDFPLEKLERVDYILINHAHGDHLADIGEIYKLYQPTVLCHPIIAMELSEKMDIPYSKITPIDNGHSYDFGSFRLETFLGRHVGPMQPSLPSEGKLVDKGTSLETLGKFGTMFNTNFVITTQNGFRVGFAPGVTECLEWTGWDRLNIDFFLRQYYPADRPIVRKKTIEEEFADELQYVGAPIAWPLHHEMTYDQTGRYDNMADFVDRVNAILVQRGSNIRMHNPDRGVWYALTLGIAAM